MGKSIGMIETVGYTAAVRAADIMVKMAYVEIVSIEFVGAGFVTVVVEGDIESVKVALEVGAEAAQQTGELVAVHSIAKPLLELDKVTSVKPSPAPNKADCEQDGDGINESV